MPKAVTILDLKHYSDDGAQAIRAAGAGRMLQTLRVRGGMSRDKGHALLECFDTNGGVGL